MCAWTFHTHHAHARQTAGSPVAVAVGCRLSIYLYFAFRIAPFSFLLSPFSFFVHVICDVHAHSVQHAAYCALRTVFCIKYRASGTRTWLITDYVYMICTARHKLLQATCTTPHIPCRISHTCIPGASSSIAWVFSFSTCTRCAVAGSL